MTSIAVNDQLIGRVLGEFREMPGLQVSLPQAQRLFALDAETCQALLDALVRSRLLERTADGRAFLPAGGR